MSTIDKTPERLIEECQGLVHSLARKIHRSLPERIDVDDLIGYGQVGLAQAAQAFDPQQGVKFSTFAYYRIRGAIYDGLAEMSWFRRASRSLIKYEQMANDILQSENLSPRSASALPVNDEANRLQQMVASMATVYLFSGSVAAGENDAQSLADSSALAPPEAAAGGELRGALLSLVEALPPDERLLIQSTYFEGSNLQQTAQIMGISRSWASRLHAKTLRRLAESLKQLGFADEPS